MLMLASSNAFAQEDDDIEPEQDSIAVGYNTGSIKLGNPPSILEAYTYDPVTDRYIYTNTVDGFNINYPVIMTRQEYQE